MFHSNYFYHMRMNIFLSFVIGLLSVNSVNAQGTLSLKNYPKAQIIINNQVEKAILSDLNLLFDAPDSVLIEIRKDGFSSKRLMYLTESRSYEVVEASKDNYKIRLRDNVVMLNPVDIVLDSLVLKENLQLTFLKQLEEKEFEFDKVNLLCNYLRVHKENNDNLSFYLSTLNHDFSKWQVIEVVQNENLMDLDYEVISSIFSSDAYKHQLKSMLKK